MPNRTNGLRIWQTAAGVTMVALLLIASAWAYTNHATSRTTKNETRLDELNRRVGALETSMGEAHGKLDRIIGAISSKAK